MLRCSFTYRIGKLVQLLMLEAEEKFNAGHIPDAINIPFIKLPEAYR